MELGFNLLTHKVEKMYDYEVVSSVFNFEERFNSCPLNEASTNLEELFKDMTAIIEPRKNYHFTLLLNNNESMEYEDYFTLFAAFSFALANLGKPNRKGYLKVNDSIRNRVNSTDYSMVKILNHDYDFGIIQLTLEDSQGFFTKWVNK